GERFRHGKGSDLVDALVGDGDRARLRLEARAGTGGAVALGGVLREVFADGFAGGAGQVRFHAFGEAFAETCVGRLRPALEWERGLSAALLGPGGWGATPFARERPRFVHAECALVQ